MAQQAQAASVGPQSGPPSRTSPRRSPQRSPRQASGEWAGQRFDEQAQREFLQRSLEVQGEKKVQVAKQDFLAFKRDQARLGAAQERSEPNETFQIEDLNAGREGGPETEEASKDLSAFDRKSAAAAERAHMGNDNYTRWQPVKQKNSRALVFTQTNDYGVNVNTHTQTQNELNARAHKANQLKGNLAGNNATARQKPAQLDLSPLTSVFSSINKSQRNTQGYIIGDNCYSPHTLKNESSSVKQVDRTDRVLQQAHRRDGHRMISTSITGAVAGGQGVTDAYNPRDTYNGRALQTVDAAKKQRRRVRQVDHANHDLAEPKSSKSPRRLRANADVLADIGSHEIGVIGEPNVGSEDNDPTFVKDTSQADETSKSARVTHVASASDQSNPRSNKQAPGVPQPDDAHTMAPLNLMNIQNHGQQLTADYHHEEQDPNLDEAMQEVMNLLESQHSNGVLDKLRMASPSFAAIDPQNSRQVIKSTNEQSPKGRPPAKTDPRKPGQKQPFQAPNQTTVLMSSKQQFLHTPPVIATSIRAGNGSGGAGAITAILEEGGVVQVSGLGLEPQLAQFKTGPDGWGIGEHARGLTQGAEYEPQEEQRTPTQRKFAFINYSEAISAAETIKRSQTRNQAEIQRLKHLAKQDLLKYSITVHHQPAQSNEQSPSERQGPTGIDRGRQEDASRLQEQPGNLTDALRSLGITSPSQLDERLRAESPRYAVDEAIAMTASKFIPLPQKKQLVSTMAPSQHPYSVPGALGKLRDGQYPPNTKQIPMHNDSALSHQLGTGTVQADPIESPTMRSGNIPFSLYGAKDLVETARKVNEEGGQTPQTRVSPPSHHQANQPAGTLAAQWIIELARGGHAEEEDTRHHQDPQMRANPPDQIRTRGSAEIQKDLQKGTIGAVMGKASANESQGGQRLTEKDKANASPPRGGRSGAKAPPTVKPSNVMINVSPGRPQQEIPQRQAPSNNDKGLSSLDSQRMQIMFRNQRNSQGSPFKTSEPHKEPFPGLRLDPPPLGFDSIASSGGHGESDPPTSILHKKNNLSIDFQNLEVLLRNQKRQLEHEYRQQTKLFRNIQRLQYAKNTQNANNLDLQISGSIDSLVQSRPSLEADCIDPQAQDARLLMQAHLAALGAPVDMRAATQGPPDEATETMRAKKASRCGIAQFNSLDARDKLQIQDNLNKMYQRFQVKNLNSHYKRQKMPFNHFSHPENQAPAAASKVPSSSPNYQQKSLQAKKDILLSVYDQMQNKSLQRSRKRSSPVNASTSVAEPTTLTSEEDVADDHDAQTATQPGNHNIMPAPQQHQENSRNRAQHLPTAHDGKGAARGENMSAIHRSFQNGLIQMKISENISVANFQGGEGGEHAQSTSTMLEHSRATAAGVAGNSGAASKNPCSFQNSARSTNAQQEQGNLINELREIDFQMKNLQDVYSKNQEVLRQIKVQRKVYKHAAGKGAKKPKQPRSSSPSKTSKAKEQADKELAVQQQQEELQKILFHSQMKNLQIQQKLKQKSELQMQILESCISGKNQTKPTPPDPRGANQAGAVQELIRKSIEVSIGHSGPSTPRSTSFPAPAPARQSPKRDKRAGRFKKTQIDQINDNFDILKQMYQTFSFVAAQHQQSQLQSLENEQSMHIFQNSQIAQMQGNKAKGAGARRAEDGYSQQDDGEGYHNNQCNTLIDSLDKIINSRKQNRDLIHVDQPAGTNEAEDGESGSPQDGNLFNTVTDQQSAHDYQQANDRPGNEWPKDANSTGPGMRSSELGEHARRTPSGRRESGQSGNQGPLLDQTQNSSRTISDNTGQEDLALVGGKDGPGASARKSQDTIIQGKDTQRTQLVPNSPRQAPKVPEALEPDAGAESPPQDDHARDADSPAPEDLELAVKSGFNVSIGGTKLQAPRHQAGGSPDYSERQTETAVVTPQDQTREDGTLQQHGGNYPARPPQLDLPKIADYVNFQRQNLFENFYSMLDQRSPTVKELMDEFLNQQDQPDVKSNFRGGTSPQGRQSPGYARMGVKGKELKLRDAKEDQVNLLERGILIKKLDKSFVKLNSPKKDDFLREAFASYDEQEQRLQKQRDQVTLTPPQTESLTNSKFPRKPRMATEQELHLFDQAHQIQSTQPRNAGVLGAMIVNSAQAQQDRALSEQTLTQLQQFKAFQDALGTWQDDQAEETPGIESIDKRLAIMLGQNYLKSMSSGGLESGEGSNSVQSFIGCFNDFKNFDKIRHVLGAYFESAEEDDGIQEIRQMLRGVTHGVPRPGQHSDVPKELQNKLVAFKERQHYLLKDQLYLTQPELAEKNLAVDLFYKQREKLRKDGYLKHVADKLEATVVNIENEGKKHRAQLVADGGLFADDCLPAKNPPKEQNPAKSADADEESGRPARDQELRRKQEHDLEHRKFLVKREKMVYDALSSDRSKYGEKLDVDRLTKEIYEDPEVNEGIERLNRNDIRDQGETVPNFTERALATGSVGADLASRRDAGTASKQADPSQRAKDQTPDLPGEAMKNGYEMSVHKLAKVPTQEHDSILSTHRSRWRANNEDGAKPKTSGAPFEQGNNQKKYFQKGGRVRSRSNAPMGPLLAPAGFARKTAPGGDRGAHGEPLQRQHQGQISIRGKIAHSRDDRMARTIQMESLENSTATANGLIQRGDLRFQQILRFDKHPVKKSDVKNFDENQRLHQMRQVLRDGSRYQETDQQTSHSIDQTLGTAGQTQRSRQRGQNKSICLAGNIIGQRRNEDTSTKSGAASEFLGGDNDYVDHSGPMATLLRKQQKESSARADSQKRDHMKSILVEGDQTGELSSQQRLPRRGNATELRESKEETVTRSDLKSTRRTIMDNTQPNSPKGTEYRESQATGAKNRFFKQRGSVQTAPRSNVNCQQSESSKQCNTSRFSYLKGSRGSSNPAHGARMPAKVNDGEYMAFIANRRPILPALREVVKNHMIEESLQAAQPNNKPKGGRTQDQMEEERQAANDLVAMKQDKNFFQLDLLIDRAKRDGTNYLQTPLSPSEQKQNTNALVQGIGLRQTSRGDVARMWKNGRRKGSVPIAALYKQQTGYDLMDDLKNIAMHDVGYHDQVDQPMMVSPQIGSTIQTVPSPDARDEITTQLSLRQSLARDQSGATEGSALMMAGGTQFEEEPPLFAQKSGAKGATLATDNVPQGYRTFEEALVHNTMGSSLAAARDLSQELDYIDATLDARLTGNLHIARPGPGDLAGSLARGDAGDVLSQRQNKALIDQIIEKSMLHGEGPRPMLSDRKQLQLQKAMQNAGINFNNYSTLLPNSQGQNDSVSRQRRDHLGVPHLPDLKERSSNNLRLKVKSHMMDFEPIQAKEFIQAFPRMRSRKEESARILGDQYKPEALKAQQEQMKALEAQQEQELQRFLSMGVGLGRIEARR